MKVLEIKGFMFFSRDYEGDHEVVRWRWAEGGKRREGGLAGLLGDGGRLLREGPDLGIDVIVCQSFGLGYGQGKGAGGHALRHWTKARYESLLIRLVRRIKNRCGAPLAVVDISDDPTIHPVNVPLLEEADCFFKRELPLDPYHALESLRKKTSRAGALMDRKSAAWGRWVGKLHPLPLGCAALEPLDDRFQGPLEKDWDIFYAGDDPFRPRRRGIVAALEALRQKGLKVRVPESPLSIEDYLDELSRSHLAVSPPGIGWDCHRHYEAAFVGSVPVTPFPTIQRHAPLRNGEHCLFYDPEKSLAPQLEEMLADKTALAAIAGRARAHACRHLTHRAIFDHVVTRTAADHAKSGK